MNTSTRRSAFKKAQTILSLVSASFLAFGRATATAADLPLLEDPAALGLRVVSADRIDSILDESARVAINPTAGAQLVVVTLQGKARKPCRMLFEVREFAIHFEWETPGPDGTPVRMERVHTSNAIGIGTNGWVVARADPTGGGTLLMARF